MAKSKKKSAPSNTRVVYAVIRGDGGDVELFSKQPKVEITQTVYQSSTDGGKTWKDTDTEETDIDVDGPGFIHSFCSAAEDVLPPNVKPNKVYKITIVAEEVG
jgi:hypothetical protein